MTDEDKLYDLERLYEKVKDHPIMGANLKYRIEALRVKLYMTGKADVIGW